MGTQVYADALRIDGTGRFVGGAHGNVRGGAAVLRHEVREYSEHPNVSTGAPQT